MSTLQIRKLQSGAFKHVDSIDGDFFLGRFNFKQEFNKAFLVEAYGAKRRQYSITEIEVIYSTDENGSGVTIENWKTISDIYIKIINDVKNDLTSEEEKIYSSVLNPIINAISKQEGVEEYCAKELKLFHFPFGVEFDPEEELTYDQIIPSPYSKEGLKAKTRVYFEDHNYKDSHCTFYS